MDSKNNTNYSVTYGMFLHIYQPPHQKEDLVRLIVDQSYQKIADIAKNNERAKITINISGCLTEQLANLGYKSLLKEFADLAKSGKLEFVESANYHAFLPLIPETEIERQFMLNHKINKRYFGSAYNPVGVYIPEMAYHKKVAKVVSKMGYEWILLNETAYKGTLLSDIDFDRTFRVKEYPKVKVFFRDRRLSDSIINSVFTNVADLSWFIKNYTKPGEYVVTALDGEVFGHHRPGLEIMLDELFKSPEFDFVTISQLSEFYPREQLLSPVPSTWASLQSELDAKIPYAQWSFPGNKIHKMQWELTRFAIEKVNKSANKDSAKWRKARKFLDEGLYSCQYWWAGAVPWWGVSFIEAGAYLLKQSVLSLPGLSKKDKIIAENLYAKIIFMAFDWERSGYAHKKSAAYTAKIRKELLGEFSTREDKIKPRDEWYKSL